MSENRDNEQSPSTATAPTTRHEVEMILTRQLAGYLALPIVLVDPSHEVVYYNEPAEVMLGRRFDEGGPVPWKSWTAAFSFVDEHGNQMAPEEMPISVALARRQLAHRELWMQGLDGVRRHMAETAIPLLGNGGRFLGAVAIFSELDT